MCWGIDIIGLAGAIYSGVNMGIQNERAGDMQAEQSRLNRAYMESLQRPSISDMQSRLSGAGGITGELLGGGGGTPLAPTGSASSIVSGGNTSSDIIPGASQMLNPLRNVYPWA